VGRLDLHRAVYNGTDKAKAIHERIIEAFPDGVSYLNATANLDETEFVTPVIAIGGDGFLLETVSEYGLDEYYLPLNAGHMGFLLNDIDNVDNIIEKMIIKDWQAYRFPVLTGLITLESGEVESVFAVNDIYLERATGQTARINVNVDGEQLVEQMAADGIIVSSAIGSTGYNFSAGGSVCAPDLAVMSISPICPHHPRIPSFVLGSRHTINLSAQDTEKRPVKAMVDGRAYENVVNVEVGIDRRNSLRLIYFGGHGFERQLTKKLLRRFR
jgi:NAD+ kinase